MSMCNIHKSISFFGLFLSSFKSNQLDVKKAGCFPANLVLKIYKQNVGKTPNEWTRKRRSKECQERRSSKATQKASIIKLQNQWPSN